MKAVRRQDGVAILAAIMALLLMTAIGTALIASSSSETIIAAHFRDAAESRYAAAAMLERGMDDLLGAGDWSPVISGLIQSAWVDGPPTGRRTLSDGSSIDLTQVVNVANCQKSTTCAQAEIIEATSDRPWGASNPEWKLYAYGPLRDVLASPAIESRFYVVLLVGQGPGTNLLAMRAEAFGPRGAHGVVEATAGRTGGSGSDAPSGDQGARDTVKVLSWREVR